MNEVGKWLGEQAGNILGVLGLVTGFIFYWMSRKPKMFGWEVVRSTRYPFASGRHWIDDCVPLVPDSETIVVRLGNPAKAEIKAEDFDAPIAIRFEEGNVLAANIVDKHDELIRTNVSVRDNKTVVLEPALLNRGEWVELAVNYVGDFEIPHIEVRIAGQTRAPVDVWDRHMGVWGSITMVLFVGGFIYLMVLFAIVQSSELHEHIIVPGFALVFGLIAAQRSTVEVPGWAKKVKKFKASKA